MRYGKITLLFVLGGALFLNSCILKKRSPVVGGSHHTREDDIEEDAIEIEVVEAIPPRDMRDPEKPDNAKPVMNDSTESAATSTGSFLALARARFDAGATQEDLDAGKAIYYGQCAKCHPWKDAKKYTPEKWEKILTAMSPKAKLDPVQTAQVRLYSLTYQAAP
jgi:hypothetical protein